MSKPASLPFSGSLLREHRERQGLTQQQLADGCAAAGRPMTPGQISRLENGRHRPTPRVLKALATALSFDTVDPLLDGEQDRVAVGQ